MRLRRTDLAKSIELMLLRPRATAADRDALVRRALELHVAALCVPPSHVAACAAALSGSDVKLVALISHPHGHDAPVVKAMACREALRDGAGEVEIVVDLGAFASGDPNHVRDELRLCSQAAREARTGTLVRASLETGLLDDRSLRLAARAVAAAGVDLVATSSGLAPEPQDALDVELLREELDPAIGVKAVRAARSADEVLALLAAGAARVGLAAPDALLPAEG